MSDPVEGARCRNAVLEPLGAECVEASGKKASFFSEDGRLPEDGGS